METDVAETPGKRALPPQDSPFSQENCTEEGEVAALRLTARSQNCHFVKLRRRRKFTFPISFRLGD
uniref:Zinc finger protein 286A n=1 Tax=Bos indicus x Bos taurus TaxID=30522 RepID=A0A4W2HT08_BOBOX